MRAKLSKYNKTYFVRIPIEYVREHRLVDTMSVDFYINQNGSITVKPVKTNNCAENGTR